MHTITMILSYYTCDSVMVHYNMMALNRLRGYKTNTFTKVFRISPPPPIITKYTPVLGSRNSYYNNIYTLILAAEKPPITNIRITKLISEMA